MRDHHARVAAARGQRRTRCEEWRVLCGGRVMKIPDRETARHITWITDGLLSHGGSSLPAGLMAALREFKSALLAECAQEHWARTGQRTRYGILADLIGQQIMNGEWGPGERMPSADCFAARHTVKRATA